MQELTPTVLLVDDEPDILTLLELTLDRMGLACHKAATLADARSLLARNRYVLCLTDMRLPDGNGIDLVREIATLGTHLPVAVITAHGNVESAVESLKAGAYDFVSKPVDLGILRTLVTAAVKGSTSPRPDRRTRHILLGDSEPMRRLRGMISKVSSSQAPIYISGESGTGKELVARLIHAQSNRHEGPFVPVNCGALPAELMESELFGHKKGSFTGAVSDNPGMFRTASGGTLFLDEVADLPLPMQVKLLRAIQEKRIRRVGAAQEQPVDCRILSATHKDLAALVANGSFRQDLYYRINVIELKVPPLRERGDDIELLANHFLDRLADGHGGTRARLREDAWLALKRYRFPGNVRELENVLERACTLAEGAEIGVADLQLPMERLDTTGPLPLAVEPPDGELQSYLDDVERKRILDALEKTRWNKTQAAKLLGISFRALRYRLDKLGLD